MKIIVFIESVVGICGAVFCFLYYSGRIKYKGEKEEERKSKVQKHGKLILFAGILLTFFSLALMISAF